MYKKRSGTSGIRGHLYETKLLSLLLFKALHNDNVEEFYLGTNIDEIGAFDDICLKAKIKGHSRPLAIFLQAKHRESDNRVLAFNKHNLVKYFESFLKIRTKFDIHSKDKFFNSKFEDTECVFILYTTQPGHFNKDFEGIFANILNDLIATGPIGCQQLYTNEDVKFLNKIAIKEEIEMLATRFIKFLYNKSNHMNDELILRYHVLLARKVINVSDIQPKGHRIGKFRLDFFSSKEDYLILFKDRLNKEVLSKKFNKNKDSEVEQTPEEMLTLFFKDPTEYTLGDLISQNIITYRNGQLEFIDEMPANTVKKLKKINLSQSILDLAIAWAVRDILKPLNFELPAAFGNRDLMIKGEKRINYLTKKLQEYIENSSPSSIITIDETNADDGFLTLNGGLGSAVGNILLYDENTKLFHFTDSLNLLEKHSKSLLQRLKSKINNLEKYRLNVKVTNFPRLSFDYNDQDMVEDFFRKLVFFTDQNDESGVERILKQEIDDHESVDTKSFQVKSEAIFLNFHEEIQKWWMKQKRADYLVKTCDLYKKAKSNIINDPTITVISMMYMSEIRNIECRFKDSATISFKSVNQLGRNIVVTDISSLALIKLTQTLKIKDYMVLDFKYMLNLPMSDFRSLTIELKKTNKEKNIIIICDNIQNITITSQRNLQDIARAVIDKRVIVITNKMFLDLVIKYFEKATVINDESNSLLDLDQESQTELIKTTKVIFQGQEVTLDLLIDDVSVAFIKGAILNKVLLNETIIIGESLEFPDRPIELLRYDATQLKYEIKDLYIDRRVSRNKTEFERDSKLLQTVHDINDDVVLITAKPGMGKSTLLSYLSIKTKEFDTKLWLMRINLLDYSKQFSKWKKNKTVINIVEVLRFMCQVVLKNKLTEINTISISLSDINGEVCLDQIYDEWTTFELKMFLNFFKKGDIVFLFDGFDEICPNYEYQVISFLNAIKDYPQKHKIWITSRPYDKIKYILQQNFNISDPYELEPFSDIDQEIYFEKFWKYNIDLNELNSAQIQNLEQFINFMLKRQEEVFVDNFIRQNKPQNYLLNKVYFHFMVYLQSEMKSLPMAFPLNWAYKDKLVVSLRISKLSQTLYRQDVGERGIKDILEFVGTPLHLYLVADYFLSGIKDDSERTNEWDLDVNTYAIYESFLESKLKKIRFQDKNKMDMDIPDVMETYKTVRKAFIDMHKKLAAYAIFQLNGQEIFNEEQLQEITSMIEKITRGSEKTGLIYNVTNNTPQFIHMTFTEYFAVEYISDLLKNEKCPAKQEDICKFILNTMILESPINVLNIMDQKLKMDTEFGQAVEKHSYHIFNVLMTHNIENDDDTVQAQIKSPIFEAISKNLNNFLSIFMSTLQSNVNKSNLNDFIEVIIKSEFLKIAATKRYDDLIVNVLKLIREIDISKWRSFLSCPRYYCYDIIKNYEVQRALRHHFLSFFIRSEVSRQESVMANIEEA